MEIEKVASWIKPITIGNLTLANNILFAPMAGGSELAFRKICHRMGAGLVCTELVTARGIRYQKSIEKNYRYLEISPDEFPIAIQLFGSETLDFEIAIKTIFEHPLLSQCSAIDINMGCPAPKVVKTGAGSALMKNLPLASSIIVAAVKASPVPVTVKFRKGWNEETANAPEFARMCEESGASLIAVHGRTTRQMYSGKADWDIIRKAKEVVKIPVIGNGDVMSPQTALEMFEQTKVDGIMIGRAALGNPWIFKNILSTLGKDLLNTSLQPSLNERVEIMKEHLYGSIEQMGETTAMKEMRKHFTWYLKGVHGTSHIRQQLMTCTRKEETLGILDLLVQI